MAAAEDVSPYARLDAARVHEHVEDGPCLCPDCSREAMLEGYRGEPAEEPAVE